MCHLLNALEEVSGSEPEAESNHETELEPSPGVVEVEVPPGSNNDMGVTLIITFPT